MITTITGIPSDFVKTPSASGKITFSSPWVGLNAVLDAREIDEAELGTRELLFIVVDDADDVNIIDESFGSI